MPVMIRPGALLAIALVLAGPAARAQTYPSRQITLIIPFTPGGSNDLVGRAIGKKLSEVWGQPVVIENRGGGGAVIGAAAVAKDAPQPQKEGGQPVGRPPTTAPPANSGLALRCG